MKDLAGREMSVKTLNHTASPAKDSRALEELRSRLTVGLSVIVTLLGLGYLLAFLFGKIGANRFGTTEAVIFVAILLLNSSFIQRIGRLAISGKGIEFQVREVQEEQLRQRGDIESLKFLLSYFVTEQELRYLLGLAGRESSRYSNHDDWYQGIFMTELRRLRSLGLIGMDSGKTIAGMPTEGDLKDYFWITERGQTYLKLRGEIESQG